MRADSWLIHKFVTCLLFILRDKKYGHIQIVDRKLATNLIRSWDNKYAIHLPPDSN